jgi:hypothetical protein
VLGGAQVPSGVGAFPPEQIGQRGRAGAVAALAEGAAPFEIGERSHPGLIEGAAHALAEGQHPEQIGLASRRARIPQRLDRWPNRRLATSIEGSGTPRVYQNMRSKEGSDTARRRAA